MSMMDDIEELKIQQAEVLKAWKFAEEMLNKVGSIAAASAMRAQALHRMLVIKEICPAEELLELEMRCMLELSGQIQPPKIVDPKEGQEIIEAN